MWVSMGTDFADYAPFDPTNDDQVRLRSAADFIGTLKTPTWYFEGASSGHAGPAMNMGATAAAFHSPLTVSIVQGADHFSILRPVTKLVADKFLADTGPSFAASITLGEAQGAFDHRPKTNGQVGLTISPAAAAEMNGDIDPADRALVAMDVDLAGSPKLFLVRNRPAERSALTSNGASLLIEKEVISELGATTLDWEAAANRFVLRPAGASEH